MKKVLVFIAALLISLITFSSCDKEKDLGPQFTVRVINNSIDKIYQEIIIVVKNCNTNEIQEFRSTEIKSTYFVGSKEPNCDYSIGAQASSTNYTPTKWIHSKMTLCTSDNIHTVVLDD